MGNPFSVPLDPCVNKVFQCLDVKGGYIHNLEENLAALEKAMAELKAKAVDLSREVTREEDRGLQRLNQIQVWLDGVDSIEKEVNSIVTDRDVQIQRLCLCKFCSKNLGSSYRYGKRVSKALMEVERLNREKFTVVVDQPQTSKVQERQLQPIIVGQETMLVDAWNHLMEESVSIMGMYGMGGVGKTTLLTQLNNKLRNNRCGFDYVFWVVVSKELNVEKIQDEIAEKIGVTGKDKAAAIYNFLKEKKFVLFLDDIWEKVDLLEIGVPFPTRENRCKVAFTTRKEHVCSRMGVEYPMEIQCLDEEKAFRLFSEKVGQRTLGSDPEIPELARKVAKKCSGLPLALNVIGETMSSKRTVHEWHNAIVALDKYVTQFDGMDDKILPLLKYSYDDLKGEHLKPCLLYCALFPEDAEIFKDHLVDYWICEGIIDGSEGIEMAENKGYEIISSLVGASLLMEIRNSDSTIEPNRVSMHDVVREMALWIASGLGAEKESFIVRAGVGLTEIPKVKNWNVVRKMSLMANKMHQIVGRPECPELTTLLLQHTNLERISSGFFMSMRKLLVLDLSSNMNLVECPDGISELGSLQFLNLSNTDIDHLPKGLTRLEKLIHLNLDGTHRLMSIAGISNLRNLKVLKLVDSAISWDRVIVKELETLQHLEVSDIGINGLGHLKQYLRSHRLANSTRYLQVKNIHSETYGISFPVKMDRLRDFDVLDSNFSEIKMGITSFPRNTCFSSLSSVSVHKCQYLKELTFLMFATNLKRLEVNCASQLEDIINKEKACDGEEESRIVPFKKLSHLWLFDLPNLKSIYWKPLAFPCLKKIHVSYCPELKNIPKVASYQN